MIKTTNTEFAVEVKPKKAFIVGLSGKIGSGKDTVADLLVKFMPEMNFQKKSFAHNLKRITSIVSGLPMDDMFTQEGKNKKLDMYGGMTVGNLQQVIGTNLFRNHFDDMVWVKSLFAPYDPEKDNWIVTDVRFRNEADYVRKLGGILIRLEGDPNGVRARSTRDMTHPSETELDGYEHFDILMRTELGDAKERNLSELLRGMFSSMERFGGQIYEREFRPMYTI